MPDEAPVKPTAVPAALLRPGVQAAITIAVAVCVYFLFLGHSGFAFSEGQRVFPGWHMARHGDWWLPHLFEQPYLRKPPGMPWATAAMSLLLGESEFSARSVSALAVTLSALLSMFFARRWLGPAAGLYAGPAFLLTPLFWYPGCSAEIEALHNLCVLAAALITIEITLNRASRWWAALLGLALAAMALVKGPAGLPCIGGAMLGACVITHSHRPLLNPRLIAGLAFGGILIALAFWRIAARVAELPEPPVLQSADDFLWRKDKIAGVFTLPLTTLLSALPWSIALLFALAPRVKHAEQNTQSAPLPSAGAATAWAVLISLLIYTVIGVSNNRYTMPAAALIPIVAVFAGWRLSTADLPHRLNFAARWPLARHPLILLLPLFVAACAYNGYAEHRRAVRTSGQTAGIALGELLPEGAEVWGDALLDNRSEAGYYAQVRAAAMGKKVRFLWTPANMHGRGPCPLPPPGGYILLLEEGQTELPESELDRYRRAGALKFLKHLHTGRAHKFLFHLYRVVDGEQPDPVFPGDIGPSPF